MQVILIQDVNNLGGANELVTVKNGYARNFLIPQKLAVEASSSNIKQLAERLKQIKKKEDKMLAEINKVIAALQQGAVKIGAKTGTSGKIFGSVNTIQISEALAKVGFNIDRKSISINDDHIKNLGAYEAKVKLHKEVTAVVKFEIIAE